MIRALQLATVTAGLLCVTWAWLPQLAVVAPIPLVVALRGASPRRAAYLGFAVGVLQASVLSGILFAGVPLYAALLLSYGLAGALFAVTFVSLAGRRNGTFAALLAASAWVVVEWLHASLPYSASNLLGDSQHAGPLLPLARLGGSYLVSFVLLWLAASLVTSCEATAPPRRPLLPLLLSGLGVGALLVGAALNAPVARGGLSVAVVQGGLPTWLYARAEKDLAWRSLPERIYARLTREAPAAELTVWPETAVWRYLGQDHAYERFLGDLRRERGGALLVGAPRQDGASAYANAAALLTADRPIAFADKRRLALLAEIGFSPGHRPGVVELTADGPRLGVIFCLETVAPRYARDVVDAGADLVVVLAEGSRFGDTPTARIHADHSVIRAVEVGRSILHAGQHGYSTLITPDGARSPPLAPYTAAVVAGRIPLYRDATPYLRWGDWIVWLSCGVLACSAVMRLSEAARGRR